MRKFKITFDEAIGIVRAGRFMCFPNAGFAEQLRDLESKLVETPIIDAALSKLEGKSEDSPTVEVTSLPSTTLQAFIDMGMVKAADTP